MTQSQLIQSYREYERSLDRIADLAGCLEDTPEEWELIELELVVTVWETQARHMTVVFPTD